MTVTSEQAHAALALRLLLDAGDVPPPGLTVDWSLLLRIAGGNGVLVRLAARLERAGWRVPASFAAAAAREHGRADMVRSVMRRIGARCTQHGVDGLFPTAWQHAPDVGSGDLDLLLLTTEPHVDAFILDGLDAARRPPDVRDRLAGTALYWLAGRNLALDVHHGRLGFVGEHHAYPATLIRRGRRGSVAGEECFVPAPEDRLIVQGMTRLAGRRSFSIADVVTTVSTLRSHLLDWGYLIGTARRIGVYGGLCGYLSYVTQIHRELYGSALLPIEARGFLELDGWGSVRFRAGRFRFPTLRVRPRLYWRQLATATGAREWGVASRLCLVPAMAAARSLNLVCRDAGPGAVPAMALESS